MPIVVDASVAAKWLLRDEGSKSADAVLETVGHDGAIVPAIFPFEIENILIVAQRRKRIDAGAIDEGLKLLAELDLVVDPAPGRSIGRYRDIALQHALSAYDAAYVELAMRTRFAFFTADERLATAARDRNVTTVFVT